MQTTYDLQDAFFVLLTLIPFFQWLQLQKPLVLLGGRFRSNSFMCTIHTFSSFTFDTWCVTQPSTWQMCDLKFSLYPNEPHETSHLIVRLPAWIPKFLYQHFFVLIQSQYNELVYSRVFFSCWVLLFNSSVILNYSYHWLIDLFFNGKLLQKKFSSSINFGIKYSL